MLKTTPKIRVAVPFPNNGKVMDKCAASVEALRIADFCDCKESIHYVQGASISQSRSDAVACTGSRELYQSDFEFDYYLAIDSDIEFLPEHVKALIDRDVDIVCGAYQYRRDPGFTVAGCFCDNTPGLINLKTGFLPWNETGLKEVDWTGAGFLLIKKHVFEALKYPWFREEIIEFEKDGKNYASWTGEDVGFCMAAKAAGFKVYCDMDVKVNHMVAPPFTNAEDIHSPESALQSGLDSLSKAANALDMFYRVAKEYEGYVANIQKPNGKIEINKGV